MSKLLKRLCKLESRVRDSRGRPPHTKEELDYWIGQACRAIQGEEDVDMSGLTREMHDEVMAEYHAELKASGRKEVWSDEGSYVPPDRYS